MPEPCYDVFEFDEPAFELVSAAEILSGRLGPMVDNIGGKAVKIAHAVTAKVAAELTGISIAMIEDYVVKYGELGITNFSPGADFQKLEVRLNCDDRGT